MHVGPQLHAARWRSFLPPHPKHVVLANEQMTHASSNMHVVVCMCEGRCKLVR